MLGRPFSWQGEARVTAIKTRGAGFSGARQRTGRLCWSLCLGLAAFVSAPAAAQEGGSPMAYSTAVPSQIQATTSPAARADFRNLAVPRDVRQAADWVVDSGDNHNLYFVIVEKT